MTPAVLDSNVIVAGAGWRGDAYFCLVAMARRRINVFSSSWILEEARRTLARLRGRTAHDPWTTFHWFADRAQIVTPAPTGKGRSRDPKDDPILGTALAAAAKLVVTHDEDLLVLQKPFGIEIISPRQLLARLHRPID